MMERKVIIEGNISVVSLSNVGSLNEYEIEREESYEEFEVKNIMESVDALAQSGELDIVSDSYTYKVMNSEDIEYLAVSDDGSDEKEIAVDIFNLVNQTLEPIKNLLERAAVDDILYLRKEEGKANITLNLDMASSDEKMNLEYFDCSSEMDAYDLLRESYYDVVCDTFLPESLATQESSATVENYLFEPQIVYGELYKVVQNSEGIKSLDKIDLPGYYFQDTQREIDE
jgi:hypothetical protein